MKNLEGAWFAVPLRVGGFGVGVVARATVRHGVILVYLFGPRRETVPPLADVVNLDPSTAVKVARIGDLHLIDGTWPIIGRPSRWDRSLWRMPAFLNSDEISRRAYIVRYADEDPNRLVGRERVNYGTSALEENCVFGAGVIEIVMTELLSH